MSSTAQPLIMWNISCKRSFVLAARACVRLGVGGCSILRGGDYVGQTLWAHSLHAWSSQIRDLNHLFLDLGSLNRSFSGSTEKERLLLMYAHGLRVWDVGRMLGFS